MMTPADHALLQQFAADQSEAAFAALVDRHLPLVHSAALRRAHGDAHLAAEIAQATFIILARKAGDISAKTVLTGWLYRTTQFVAADALRQKLRRQQREHQAYMEATLTPNETNEAWQQLAPVLDEAMHALRTADRDAVLLRYFENKSLADVGAALGVTEDAARVRVNRALDKLRALLAKQGIKFGAALLATAVVENSVQAAPTALAAKVSVIAAKGAATTTTITTLVKGTLKVMTWTKMKVAVVVGVSAILATGLVTAVHHSSATPAAKLKKALYEKKPSEGNWQYPTVNVMQAITEFGSNRANAFPILEQAVRGSDAEASKQAIAAMGMIVRPAMTMSDIRSRFASNNIPVEKIDPRLLVILQSPPATNALPLLKEILFANNDLSSFALASLHGLFEAKDIPALADFLAKSHNNSWKPKALSKLSTPVEAQSLMDKANSNQQLQRYLPEAIAETIQQNPEAAAPFVSSVEDLLEDENADIRFGAACALAKYKTVNDPKVARELHAGLKSRHDTSRLYPNTEGLKQLMAIETLQHIGVDAKPMVPALMEYAHSIPDHLMRELALRSAGEIDGALRKTMPEVDQAVRKDPKFKSAQTSDANK